MYIICGVEASIFSLIVSQRTGYKNIVFKMCVNYSNTTARSVFDGLYSKKLQNILMY